MDIFEMIPVTNSQLTVREIGDDIVILSEETLEIHNLEGSAAFLWKCIDGKTTVGDIRDKLCHEYEVTAEQAKDDIAEFFDECEKKNLISFRDTDKE
ncbi:MAG: PqqD family protein [Spirochaetales bacterium]|nr:PqqD family protein [Spirochaetales bacterium]